MNAILCRKGANILVILLYSLGFSAPHWDLKATSKPVIGSLGKYIKTHDTTHLESLIEEKSNGVVSTSDPEISITGNSLTISNGDLSPSTGDHTNFGSVLACSGSIIRTFTISNSGTAILTVNSINISGGQGYFASTHSCTGLPCNLNPNSYMTIDITFDPSTDGIFTANVSIVSDDPNNNPFVFAIAGVGLADVTSPTITCPQSITTSTSLNSCHALVTYNTPVGVDDCPNPSTTQTAGLGSGASFPKGLTTNTFRVTDGAGQSNSCSFTVTVNDNQAPIAQCQDATINLDGNGQGSITAIDIDNNSTDNCGVISGRTLFPSSFVCTNIGINQVSMSVIDPANNMSICTANVTVLDPIPPIALCRNASVTLNTQGQAAINTSDIDNGSSDNCSGLTLTLSDDNFTCLDVGNRFIVLTATDGIGNFSTCTATVSVETLPPSVSVSANAQPCGTNISCLGGADGVVHASTISSCPGLTYLWSNGATGPNPTGLTAGTYTVTVTDISGKTSTATISLTQPNQSMTVVLNDTTSPCIGDSTGQAVVGILGGPTCLPTTYHWSTGTNSATLVNVPAGTYSVTATDGNGCTSTTNVTIINLPAPVPTFTIGPDELSSDLSWQSYQWFYNGFPISGATYGTYAYGNATGTFTLQVTSFDGCIGTSAPVIVTGIAKEPHPLGCSIYPNPNSTDKLRIEAHESIMEEVKLMVVDAQGRFVMGYAYPAFNEPIQLNIELLPSGIYTLLLSVADGRQVILKFARR